MRDEPAFPSPRDPVGHRPGMTLRDYFAGKALPELISETDPIEVRDGSNLEANLWDQMTREVARQAYLFADAMIRAREEAPKS